MALAAGTRLGPYEILAPLGAGGMGEVYRARDTRLGREVAIKVLPESFASDRRSLTRFEDEARVVASLSHPNILALHDFGEADGVVYAVTELLQGATLRERLAREKLAPRKILDIGVAVAEGLAAAHARGIVHRDLKPENIFVTTDGQVKILDFGLARVVEPTPAGSETSAPTTPTPTEPGVVMGTVGYLSPEQVRGQSADARSDIFALGCVLYEMAMGRRAFQSSSTSETLAAILRDSPQPTSTIPGLDRIVARCLEKNPDERFQSARDLAFALREVPVKGGGPKVPAAAPSRRRTRTLAVALLAAALAAAALWAVRSRSNAAGGAMRSVAVLPLDNMTGDPGQEYFADGMTEELISDLSKISTIRVPSRTSVMRYKKTTKTLTEIAKELDVDAIVEGSVARGGSRVKITAQLIDARQDRHLWADSFERELKDVLALQGEVARAIASEIGVRLSPPERSRLMERKTVDPEAYEAYLRGQDHLFRGTPADTKKALADFEAAAARQPDSAVFHSAIANAYMQAAGSAFDVFSPQEAFPKAKVAALRAVELDPNLAEAWNSLAWGSFIFDRDWAGAERKFRRALELNPNYPGAHRQYAIYLTRLGRFEEAIREAKRSQELEPASLPANISVGLALYFARRYAESEQCFRRVLEMDPSFLRAHWGLGLSLAEEKRYDEAIAELLRSVELSGDGAGQLGSLGYAYAMAGRRPEAREIVNRLEARSRERYTPPATVAIVLAALGDKDEALNLLERADDERDPWVTVIKVDPKLDGLRSEPRFRELERRVVPE